MDRLDLDVIYFDEDCLAVASSNLRTGVGEYIEYFEFNDGMDEYHLLLLF